MPEETIFLKEQLTRALQTIRYGVVLFCDDLRVVYANAAAESFLNRKRRTLMGRTITEILPEGLPDGVGSRKRHTVELSILGRTLLVDIWPSIVLMSGAKRGADERQCGLMGVQDVTQVAKLRQENLELRESSRDLNAIFDSSFDEIYVTDGEGKTLRVNSACERLYGIPATELIGRDVKELEQEGIFTPSITPLVLQSRERVTVVQDTKSGRKVIATANPVFDADGKITRIVTNSRDVTELHNLKTRLSETEALVNRYLSEVETLRQEQARIDNIVVQSQAMHRVVQSIKKAAPFESTVLLQGESGTGKDTVAKMIHQFSPRSRGPFIKVNCGAIPEALLESELFGYVSGAFTGAHRAGKAGLIELANKGTLFLNEIDALPLQLQVKLLHVVQEREFVKIGGTKVTAVDIRIVAASNKHLQQLVEQGRFREDLYYRLNVIPVIIPPLRERREDIPPLVAHFLARLCKKYGFERRVSAPAMDLLSAYAWPGNVRELENTVEHAFVTSVGSAIMAADLPVPVRAASSGGAILSSIQNNTTLASQTKKPLTLPNARDLAEKQMLQDVLTECRTTRNAAKVLGVSQSTVVRRLKRYGIKLADRREDVSNQRGRN
jgi:PAS domain S-box-containing protein